MTSLESELRRAHMKTYDELVNVHHKKYVELADRMDKYGLSSDEQKKRIKENKNNIDNDYKACLDNLNRECVDEFKKIAKNYTEQVEKFKSVVDNMIPSGNETIKDIENKINYWKSQKPLTEPTLKTIKIWEDELTEKKKERTSGDASFKNKVVTTIQLSKFVDVCIKPDLKKDIKKLYEYTKKPVTDESWDLLDQVSSEINKLYKKCGPYLPAETDSYEDLYNKYKDAGKSGPIGQIFKEVLWHRMKEVIQHVYKINEETTNLWNMWNDVVDTVDNQYKYIFDKPTYAQRYYSIVNSTEPPLPKEIDNARKMADDLRKMGVPMTGKSTEKVTATAKQTLDEVTLQTNRLRSIERYFGIKTIISPEFDVKIAEEKINKCKKNPTKECLDEMIKIVSLSRKYDVYITALEDSIPKGNESLEEIKEKIKKIKSMKIFHNVDEQTRKTIINVWRGNLMERLLQNAGYGDYKKMIEKTKKIFEKNLAKEADVEHLKKMIDEKSAIFTPANALDDDKLKPELIADLKLWREKLDEYDVSTGPNIFLVIIGFILSTIATTLVYLMVVLATVTGFILVTWLIASAITLVIQGARGKITISQIPFRFIMGWIYPILILMGKME